MKDSDVKEIYIKPEGTFKINQNLYIALIVANKDELWRYDGEKWTLVDSKES